MTGNSYIYNANINTQCRIAAIDVETTGLSPAYGGRVIEIGVVAIESGAIADEFHSLINIGLPVPIEVTRIHGITTDMLINKPKPIEVMPRLLEFIKGSILIAHNARFDIGFIRHELARLNLSMDNNSLCTLQMSRKQFPGLHNHRLQTVARHLIKDLPQNIRFHRALDDARIVAMIWMEMERRRGQ